MDYTTTVCKANSLVSATFKLTLNEQRLILACIAQIKDPRIEISRDDNFTVTAPYFSRLFNIDLKNAYSELHDAARLLTNREVIINYPDPENPKLEKTITGWVDSSDYFPGDGKVVIQFRSKMIPYLSNLKNGCFTKYRIEKVAKIKSVYAIRLYELLVSESWKNQGYKISVQELKLMFSIGASEYSRIFDLKRFIIDPAVLSINEHTDITVNPEYHKTGRNVTHITFNYLVKKPKKKQKITDEMINKHARPGESYEQAKQRLLKQKEV